MTTETRTSPEFDILNGDPIALAVFSFWMEHEEPATVAEIAKVLGWSPAKVRRGFDKHGFVTGCQWTEKEIPVRESNYGTVRHYRKAEALQPSRATLRAVILALRQRCGTLARRCGDSAPELSDRDEAACNSASRVPPSETSNPRPA